MAEALTAHRTSYTFRLYSLQAVAAQAYATLRRQLTSALLSSSLVGGHAPNPGDTAMSTPWLRNILVSAGAIPKDATVTRVECKGLDGNRGLVGVMTRVLVTYDTIGSSDSQKDSHELHLILKKSQDGRRSRLGNIVSGQAREAIFYSSKLAKTLLPSTLLPKVYYAHGSQWLGEYVILMEDIKQRGAQGVDSQKPIDVNFVFGNQIWGLPDSIQSLAPPSATEMLDQMFLTAADMHAQHWNDSRLLQWGWLKFAGWYRGSGRTQWEWSVQAGLSAWEQGKQKVASGELSVTYSEKLVRIVDESFKRASWERLQERLHNRSEPFTLCHGDFHAANMILDRSTHTSSSLSSSSSSSIVMYDWSEVCVWEPTSDLGQTLVSDVAIPVFQAHARIALQKYWERLIELGAVRAADYSFETCWKAFLRGGVEKWIWVFSILANHPGMPASLVQYFHDQLLAFIELADNGGDAYYNITMVSLFPPPGAM
ncbi:unnamed protein product [Mortierella alpina]